MATFCSDDATICGILNIFYVLTDNTMLRLYVLKSIKNVIIGRAEWSKELKRNVWADEFPYIFAAYSL